MTPVVVMGVSGSGKSTVAAALGRALGRELAEGDAFHAPSAVAAMRAGVPLTDVDRAPWLAALREWLDGHPASVLTCSALTRRYRDVLRPAVFVHLQAPRAVLLQRMTTRSGHFMPASLLDSQLALLEPLAHDEPGVVVDATLPVAEVVAQSLAGLPGPVPPHVASVSAGRDHGPHKPVRDAITLVAGLGVKGDAHLGATVQHRSRARAHPDLANLRQVHLVHAELHDELLQRGLAVGPGAMGENVLTRGVDLLALPAGAVLRLGEEAVVELTGLRNPCSQLDGVAPGLMAATLARADDGSLVRRAGVMAVVRSGGVVRAGDPVRVTLPATHVPLAPV